MATTTKTTKTTKTTAKKTTTPVTKVTKVTKKTTTKSPAKPTAKTATKTVAPKAKRSSTSRTKVATPSNKNKAKPNIALFIDVDNVGVSRENLLEILFFVSGKYNVDLCKLYGFSNDALPGIKEIASDYNLVTVGKMKFKTVGQNCLDSRILVDAYECAVKNAGRLDMIFVWCYPCDLAECFEKIIEQGVATSTIDNRIFDCKNKFVSQVFKLYSAYAFGGDTPMYGQVQNLPTPNLKTTAEPNPVVAPESVKAETATATVVSLQSTPLGESAVAETATDTNELADTLDGRPVPVLPRREIVERSHKPTPNAKENVNKDEMDAAAGENIVDAISRKLNITRPNLVQVEQEFEQRKKEKASDTVSLLDMIKKVGIIDDNEGKPKKYEDTIGDL